MAEKRPCRKVLVLSRHLHYTATSRCHLRPGGQAFGACRKATGYLSGVAGAQQLNSIRQISGNCTNGLFVSILN